MEHDLKILSAACANSIVTAACCSSLTQIDSPREVQVRLHTHTLLDLEHSLIKLLTQRSSQHKGDGTYVAVSL